MVATESHVAVAALLRSQRPAVISLIVLKIEVKAAYLPGKGLPLGYIPSQFQVWPFKVINERSLLVWVHLFVNDELVD